MPSKNTKRCAANCSCFYCDVVPAKKEYRLRERTPDNGPKINQFCGHFRGVDLAVFSKRFTTFQKWGEILAKKSELMRRASNSTGDASVRALRKLAHGLEKEKEDWLQRQQPVGKKVAEWPIPVESKEVVALPKFGYDFWTGKKIPQCELDKEIGKRVPGYAPIKTPKTAARAWPMNNIPELHVVKEHGVKRVVKGKIVQEKSAKIKAAFDSLKKKDQIPAVVSPFAHLSLSEDLDREDREFELLLAQEEQQRQARNVEAELILVREESNSPSAKEVVPTPAASEAEKMMPLLAAPMPDVVKFCYADAVKTSKCAPKPRKLETPIAVAIEVKPPVAVPLATVLDISQQVESEWPTLAMTEKKEAQQVALPAEIHQECQKQRTRKPATSGWFSSNFSKAYHGAKKFCSSATKTAKVENKQPISCEIPSNKEIKDEPQKNVQEVEKPQEVEGLCIHKPCKKDKIPSQKASAKEAKNQLKKLAKNQEETILPGHPDVTAPVVASPLENKKRRKQRHRLFFRLRQKCLKIWARLFVLSFARSERKDYQQPRRRNICRHYQLRQKSSTAYHLPPFLFHGDREMPLCMAPKRKSCEACRRIPKDAATISVRDCGRFLCDSCWKKIDDTNSNAANGPPDGGRKSCESCKNCHPKATGLKWRNCGCFICERCWLKNSVARKHPNVSHQDAINESRDLSPTSEATYEDSRTVTCDDMPPPFPANTDRCDTCQNISCTCPGSNSRTPKTSTGVRCPTCHSIPCVCSQTPSSSRQSTRSRISSGSASRQNRDSRGRFTKSASEFDYDTETGLTRPGDTTDDDATLMPPPSSLSSRRSSRIRKQPTRFNPGDDQRMNDVPITPGCRLSHKERGCGAFSVGHMPRYYNSLRPYGDKKQYRCPHCVAFLLKSEATGPSAYSKCCAKGKVKMEDAFYNLQKPILLANQRRPEDQRAHQQMDPAAKELDVLLATWLHRSRRGLPDDNAEDFLNNITFYNNEFACGCATTEQEPSRPGGYQPIKMNGMVTYRTSGMFPPLDDEGNPRPEMFGQVWTLNPDESVARRQQRGGPRRLNPEYIKKLDAMMRNEEFGHPYARAYHRLKELYDQETERAARDGEPRRNMRIKIISREQARKEGAAIDPAIHPHRTLVSDENLDQLAQVYFVDDDEGLPPTEELGVVITDREGETKILPWYHSAIDHLLLPILFSRDNSWVWKAGIPLNEQERDEPEQIPVDNVELNMDEMDREENYPHADEDPNDIDPLLNDDPDNDGEGEGFLLDREDEFQADMQAHIDEESQERHVLQEEDDKRQHVTRTKSFRFVTQIRPPPQNAGSHNRNMWHDPHWLFGMRRLFEYYVCLYNNRVEREKHQWIKKTQENLRYELPKKMIEGLEATRKRQNIRDRNDQRPVKLGKIYLAKPSMKKTRPYMDKHYADGMAMCRELGNPHLFVTFTMNRECQELKYMMWPNQKWYHRPDLVNRLYLDKEKEFIKDIVQRQCLGPVKGVLHVIEHQDRGPPHKHIVVWLDWDKIAESGMSKEEYIDEYIQAEIPLPPKSTDNSKAGQLQKRYKKFVEDSLYHTCGDWCSARGRCDKYFPRPYSETTVVDDHAFRVLYRRRPHAQTQEEYLTNPEILAPPLERNKKNNRQVVPHNKYLVMKYQSHINVEWLHGDACIKYVLEYITKGGDKAYASVVSEDPNIDVFDFDELNQIRMVQFKTASEHLLDLWGTRVVRKSHQVDAHYIHLPDGRNRVWVDGMDEIAAEQEQARMEEGIEQKHSPLLAYFRFNRDNPLVANNYTYQTIGMKYWYNKQKDRWILRKILPKNHIVRLGRVSASDPEAQALRLLLLHVHGPKDWPYMGKDSFVEAAKHLGLIEDPAMWIRTINESFGELRSIRKRYYWLAQLIATSNIPAVNDVMVHVINQRAYPLIPKNKEHLKPEDKLNYVLQKLDLILRTFGKSCEVLGLTAQNDRLKEAELINAVMNPDDFLEQHLDIIEDQGIPPEERRDINNPRTLQQFKNYDRCFYQKLNAEQKQFVDQVMTATGHFRSLNPDQYFDPTRVKTVEHVFNLKGDGGTGKSFTENVLIARLKARGYKVMATATTGKAALLLFGGRTMHSALRIPLNIHWDTRPKVDYASKLAEMLRHVDVLIIDEISAGHKNVINYIDTLFRDVAEHDKKNLRFGGKIVIMSGDWKQLLPVVKGGDIYAAYFGSPKTMDFFTRNQVAIHRLTRNQRLLPGQEEYNKKLKIWGTGVGRHNAIWEKIDPSMHVNTLGELIQFVFRDGIKDPMNNLKEIQGSAILCPLNDEVFEINEMLLKQFNGPERTYASIDQVLEDSPEDILSQNVEGRNIEDFYRRTPEGMPEHQLKLKIGAIMMVIRNVNTNEGIANGTRVQIVKLLEDTVVCRHIEGNRIGETFPLARFRFKFGGTIEDATTHGGVEWERLQFPLRPGFVMTINKAQGQTLDRVGLYVLHSQPFAHGQFYTAMSRVRDQNSIRICAQKRADGIWVKNIVLQEIVDKEDMEEAEKYLREMPVSSAPDVPLPPAPKDVPLAQPLHDMPAPNRPIGIRMKSFLEPMDGMEIEDAIGDGDCFYWALIQALYGASDREITDEEQAIKRQQQLALRRLIARHMMREYTLDYDEERRLLATEAAELDRTDMANLGIMDFPAYLRYMMDPPIRGADTTYANSHLEGLAAAAVLKRTVIVESVRYDEAGELVERAAVLYSRRGLELHIRNLTSFEELLDLRAVKDADGIRLAKKDEQGQRIVDPIVIRNIQRDGGYGHRLMHNQTVHLRRPGEAYAQPKEDALQFLASLSDVPSYMWTPEEEEEEEEEQQPNQPQEDRPVPPMQEKQPQPPVTVHDDDPRLRTHRNFSWEKGHQIEAVEGDGNCFYRAILGALHGPRQVSLSPLEMRQLEQRVWAMRRLCARRLMRQYTRNQALQLVYDDSMEQGIRDQGIQSFPEYLEMMFNQRPEDHIPHWAWPESGFEAPELARLLNRYIVVQSEQEVVDKYGRATTKMSAQIFSPSGHFATMKRLDKLDNLHTIALVRRPDNQLVIDDGRTAGEPVVITRPIVVRNIAQGHFAAVHLHRDEGWQTEADLKEANADLQERMQFVQSLDDVPHEMWTPDEEPEPTMEEPAPKKKNLAKRILKKTMSSFSNLSVSSLSSTEQSPKKKLPRGEQQQTPPRKQTGLRNFDSPEAMDASPSAKQRQRTTEQPEVVFKTPERGQRTPTKGQRQSTTPQNPNMEGFSLPEEATYHQTGRGYTPASSERSSIPATPKQQHATPKRPQKIRPHFATPEALQQMQREWKTPTSLCNVSPNPSSGGSETTLADEVQQLRWDFFVEIANTNEGAADLSLDYVRELYKNRWIDQNILWKRIDLENDRENAKRGEKNRRFEEACAATKEADRRRNEAHEQFWDDIARRDEEKRKAAQQVEAEKFRQYCIRMTKEENEKNKEKEKKAKERAEYGRICREKLAEMEREEIRNERMGTKTTGPAERQHAPTEEQPSTSRQQQMPMEEQPSSSRQHQHIPVVAEDTGPSQQQEMPSLQERYWELLRQLRPGIQWGQSIPEQQMDDNLNQMPRVPSEAIFELNVMNMPRVLDWPPHWEEFPKVPTKPPGYKSQATIPPQIDPNYKE